jgi:hypothetical protein
MEGRMTNLTPFAWFPQYQQSSNNLLHSAMDSLYKAGSPLCNKVYTFITNLSLFSRFRNPQPEAIDISRAENKKSGKQVVDHYGTFIESTYITDDEEYIRILAESGFPKKQPNSQSKYAENLIEDYYNPSTEEEEQLIESILEAPKSQKNEDPLTAKIDEETDSNSVFNLDQFNSDFAKMTESMEERVKFTKKTKEPQTAKTETVPSSPHSQLPPIPESISRT